MAKNTPDRQGSADASRETPAEDAAANEKDGGEVEKAAAPVEKAAAEREKPVEKEAAAASEKPVESEAHAAAAKSAPASAPARKGKAWGEPFARFEAAWTRFETRLITWVLVAQLVSMVAWVLLSGLSSPLQSGNLSGLVMRAMIGALALGAGGWFVTRKQSLNVRRGAAIGGLVLGILLARVWRTVGVEYFDNLKAWLQEGSSLTMMGGLRGVATRLTLWLALLGGSLATASGKHINIDVVFRFVPPRFRLPIAVVNYCAAALVCFSAVWGFFDHIAIESFGANADDTPGTKVSVSLTRMDDHFFLTRKQLGLDLKTFPHIVKGDRFDRWMGGAEWNAWVKGADFESKYPKEEVETLLVADDAPPHTPLVVAPDGEATRGILVHDLSLVFPFGMLMIALRFVLRALLSISGHIEVDPDAAHKEEIGQHTASAGGPEKGGV
jgi:TRAP-type C4-dicarboxylate transport system permease small subunit